MGMFNSCIVTFSHTWSYVFENLSCLMYGIETLLHKYLINFACYDLLVDISESFGIWIVLFILFNASLLLSVTIHSYGYTPKTTNPVSSSLNTKLSLNSFIRFITL